MGQYNFLYNIYFGVLSILCSILCLILYGVFDYGSGIAEVFNRIIYITLICTLFFFGIALIFWYLFSEYEISFKTKNKKEEV